MASQIAPYIMIASNDDGTQWVQVLTGLINDDEAVGGGDSLVRAYVGESDVDIDWEEGEGNLVGTWAIGSEGEHIQLWRNGMPD